MCLAFLVKLNQNVLHLRRTINALLQQGRSMKTQLMHFGDKCPVCKKEFDTCEHSFCDVEKWQEENKLKIVIRKEIDIALKKRGL